MLITTSDFTSAARTACSSSTKSLILINGKELVEHMFRHKLGVKSDGTYNINKIDLDFFENI